MPAVAAIAGILILTGLYLFACFAVLVFVSTPLTVAGIAIGLAIGVGLGLQRTIAVLAGRVPGTTIRTPADVVAGKLAGKVRAEFVRRDDAWPQYFVAQARLDLAMVGRITRDAVMRVWTVAVTPLVRDDSRLVTMFFWPLVLPVAAALLAFAAGAGIAVTVTAMVVGLATTVAWTLGLSVVAALRAGDRVWQRVFGAVASCPACFYVSKVPAYRCPGAHSAVERGRGVDIHRDLRPGRLGVWWRRCGCGRRLPTTVLRAAWRLEACCPRCLRSLPKGSAVATDVRFPVFGAASAGKTHLIMSGLVTMLRTAQERGHPTEFLDDASAGTFREMRALVESGQSAPKTSTATPVAVTVSLKVGQRPVLVHFFDAAGESLMDSGQNAELAYLDYAEMLVFVLDPFSIPDVRDQAGAGFPDMLRSANAATSDADQSYNATVNRLRSHSVDTRRQRLAFVVSKADLLQKLPIAKDLEPDSISVRDWLVRVGLDNLVTSASRDFAEIRFFLVSANDLSGDGGFAPFRWLLTLARVNL